MRAVVGAGTCPLCAADAVDLAAIGDLDAVERALTASLCRDSLAEFVAAYWPAVDARPFRPNTASDGLIAALQAAADGRLRRLLVEVPPGSGKSTLLTLYAAWRFARDPAHRVVRASHAYDLASRDAKRVRRVVKSDAFRAAFGVELRDDEDTAAHWATTRGGRHVAVGVGGALTGHRALEVVVDDPINAIDIHSKAARDAVHGWFTESLATRLDGDDAPIIVVGQRLGADDLIGRLREAGTWHTLTLPAEFDSRRRCVLVGLDGRELWRDPRAADGELLAPAIISSDKVAELRAQLGAATFAAQFNQAPSAGDASACPARWWKFYRAPHAPDGLRRPVGCTDAPAADLPARFTSVVIAVDPTFGSMKGDYAVAQVWAAAGGGRYLLRHWRKRAGFEEQLAAVRAFADEFPLARVVVERAANGAAIVETLAKSIPNVHGLTPLGSKAQRLAAVAPMIEAGSVYLPEHAAFTADVVEEFETFPGRHDDIVDAATYALHALAHASDEPAFAWMLRAGARTVAEGDRAVERARERIAASHRAGAPTSPRAAARAAAQARVAAVAGAGDIGVTVVERDAAGNVLAQIRGPDGPHVI